MKLIKIDSDKKEKKYIFEEELRKGVLKNAIVLTVDSDGSIIHISMNNISLGIARWDRAGFVGSYRWESEDELKKMSYLAKHFSVSFLHNDAENVDFGIRIKDEVLKDLDDPYLRKIVGEFCSVEHDAIIKLNTDRYSLHSVESQSIHGRHISDKKKLLIGLITGLLSIGILVGGFFIFFGDLILEPDLADMTLQQKIEAGILDIPAEFTNSKVPAEYISGKRNLKALLDVDFFPIFDYIPDLTALLNGKKNQAAQKQQLSSPGLVIKDKKQEMLDELLAKGKIQQLEEFQLKYSSVYNPNKGDLPDFFSDFYFFNIAPVNYKYSLDKSVQLLDFLLGNIHLDQYLKIILSEFKKYKNTYYGTEILFTIVGILDDQENLAEIILLEDWDKDITPHKLERSQRFFLANHIITGNRKILSGKKITNQKQALMYFYKYQSMILSWIQKNSADSYRKGDAMFELARLHWRAGTQLNKPALIKKAAGIWKKYNFSDNNLSKDRADTLKKINKTLASGKITDKKTQGKVNILLYKLYFHKIEKKQDREIRLLWKKN